MLKFGLVNRNVILELPEHVADAKRYTHHVFIPRIDASAGGADETRQMARLAALQTYRSNNNQTR